MSIWVCRAGRKGEHETKFLEDSRIYFTFEEVEKSMTDFKGKNELKDYFFSVFPASSSSTVQNWYYQGNSFAFGMALEEWVVLPSKFSSSLHVGKIIGEYRFDKSAPELYRHYRSVEWFAKVPRECFDGEILSSLRTPMTTFKLKQEERFKRLTISHVEKPAAVPEPALFNLEDDSLESISNHIIRNFKGHALEHLVAAILRAKGFEVYEHSAGPDHGVDLLASCGTFGFSSPKICVQVKSGDSAIERTVLDNLLGTMTNYGAEYGLLVSWSGFRSSIVRDTAKQFFRVRLWSAADVIRELLENYENLSDDIRQKIPLKRIWVLDNSELE